MKYRGFLRRHWKFPDAFDYSDYHDFDMIQDEWPWTPPPEPYTEDTYCAWGRKHYGEDWDEKREQLINGRDMYAFRDNVCGDELFLVRQMSLRGIELFREGTWELHRCKQWEELLNWARWFYGEEYLDQLASIEEDRKSTDKRVVHNAKKRARRVYEATWDRHEAVLAAGYTWDEIMTWPRLPRRLPRRTNTVDFASIGPKAGDACDDDGTDSSDNNFDDARPTASPPTDLRRMAVAGPQHNRSYALELRAIQNTKNQDLYALQVSYEDDIKMLEAARRRKRSTREEAEAQARNNDAWYDTVFKLHPVSHAWMSVFPEDPHPIHETKLKERHDQNMAILRDLVTKDGYTEGWDERYDRWAVQGITRDECNHLMKHCYNNKSYCRNRPDLHHKLFPPSLGQPQLQSREPPKDEADMAVLFRFWDGKLNQREQDALAKMYGFGKKPATDHEEEGVGEKDEKKGAVEGGSPNGKKRKAGAVLDNAPSTQAGRQAGRTPELGQTNGKRLLRSNKTVR